MGKQKLLIVEDDLDIITLMCSIIDDTKWDVTVAIDMKAALIALSQVEFDMVVSDFNFPGGDGNRVAEAAQAVGIMNVVLHTGDESSPRIKRALFIEVYPKLNRQLLKILKAA